MRHRDTYNKILNTLCCDYETGEGAVNISEKFVQQSVMFQLDVIEDWIHDLDFYRELMLLTPTFEGFDEDEADDKKAAEVIDLASRRNEKKEADDDTEE